MPSAPAVIEAALGDTVDHIAAASTYPLRLAGLQDDDLLTIQQPVQFAYRGEHGFKSPPTKLLGLTLTASILTGIEFAPQTEYLDLTGVLALFDRMSALAAKAGWLPDADQTNIVGPREVQVLASDPSRPARATWHLGRLIAGGATLLFRLRRLHPDAFLLNLAWSDEDLFHRARAVVLHLREEDHAPRDVTRPIDPSYPARARQLLAGA